MLKRIAPAAGLFFLSPLVAEFLLGNLSIAMIGALAFLAPLYGGGAILVREVVRRTGRRWPSIILLALAYGVFEEGITTQSLFNPDYVGLRLLDYGHVDALGMGIPWAMFGLTIHVVWSIATPIAVMELLTRDRGTTPWLGKVGLTVTAVMFVLGAAVSTIGELTRDPFRATTAQLIGVVVAVVLLVVAAFAIPRTAPASIAKPAPHPWLLLLMTLAGGVGVFWLGGQPAAIPAWLDVTLLLVLLAAVGAVIRAGAGRTGWGPFHHLALVTGTLLTYAWHSFPQPSFPDGNSTVDLIGNAVFAALALVLIAITLRQVRREASSPDLAGTRSLSV